MIELAGQYFTVPQDFDIFMSLDEYMGTYRISIGLVNPTETERQAYTALFNAVDVNRKDGMFLQNSISFIEDNQQLTMYLTLISILRRPYGTFYEFEAPISDVKFSSIKGQKKNVRNRGTSAAKNKETSTESNPTI